MVSQSTFLSNMEVEGSNSFLTGINMQQNQAQDGQTSTSTGFRLREQERGTKNHRIYVDSIESKKKQRSVGELIK